MFKKFPRFKQKKDSICMRTGCNNPVKRGNGTEFNFCSSSCQKSHYSPGSGELYDDFLDSSSYTSSNQWGVWSPNQDDTPPSYSSVNNKNDLFGSVDNAQVTPLWETDDPPLKPRRSSYRPSKPDDEFPEWASSVVDPLWVPTPNKKNSRNYSPPVTPRSSSPSDEEEIHCPQCTFFIRPNKTVCEMCGANITRQTRQTRQEPKKSNNKSSSKSKSTITSYRDLYEDDEDEDEEDEEEEEEEEEEDDDNPFVDTPPRRNNKYSSSSNNRSSYDYDDYRNSSSHHKSRNRSSDDYDDNVGYRNSSSTYKSRNRSSDDCDDDYKDRGSSYSQSRNRSSNDYDDYRDRGSSYSQSRNQSSRNRTYRSPTPPIEELWIDDDDDFFESVPSRKPTRHRPPHKPYNTPSFFKEAEKRSKRNVQKPPTPPLKERQITCPACNFDNHFSMTHCEICYTQLNETPEQNKKKSTNFSNFSRIEQTRPKKSCPNCSYDNDVNSAQCEMCYVPFGATNKSIFSNFTSFFSPNVDYVDKTQCPKCTFMNHKSMAQCEVCQNVLPGGNLIQQQLQYQEIVDKAPGPTTKLIQLPVNDHDYMTIQQNFKTGVPAGNILAIFRVIMPAKIIQAHEAYKKQLAGNNPAANVTHSMYHGSHVACDAKRYYGPPGWKYCAANCGLCGITQNGNSCAKSNHGGRMWFANNSGTSLGYCRNNPVKAMFVEDIISATGGGIIIVDKEAATLVKFLIIFV